MPTIPLKCRRLHADSKLPDGGTYFVDVHAYLKSETDHPIKMVLPTGIARMVPTGLHVTPTPPYAVLLFPSANLTLRSVDVINQFPPIADELRIHLRNDSPTTEWVEHGDPIAMIALIELPTIVVEEVQ